MLDVVTFLMRWMFLSNILRNVAEIQTFPQPQAPHPHPFSPQPPQQQQHHNHPNQDSVLQEKHWRNHCLQTILSYPPGSYRLLITDAYRIELVQRLAHSLTSSQECLRLHRVSQELAKNREEISGQGSENNELEEGQGDNVVLDPDADVEISTPTATSKHD